MNVSQSGGIPSPPRPNMFSNARVLQGHFFISGMHAGGSDAKSTYEQSVEAFRRILVLTAECGASVDDIMVLRIYLVDIDEKGDVGRARAEVFSGDYPCSTLVEVSALVEPGLTVEIEAQGIIGSSMPNRGSFGTLGSSGK